MGINFKDTIISILGGELLEAIAPKIFDPGAVKTEGGKDGKDAPKTAKANPFGWGKEDERLFWKAVEMASKPGKDAAEGTASMAELRVITDFSDMTHAHKRALILYIGHKEDVVKVSEEKKNADGTPFDPTKNIGKKGGGGQQPAKIVVTQFVANNDGRQKIIFLARLMRDELGYDDTTAPKKTFSAKEKTKAKKAIKEWLVNSGMLRDMSDQAEEAAAEFGQTALVIAKKLGFDHKSVQDLDLDLDRMLLKSELALIKARAK